MFLHGFLQPAGADFCINLSGLNVFMPKQFLNADEVGAALQQRAGETVAEGVGTRRLFQAGFSGPGFNPPPNVLAGGPPASVIANKGRDGRGGDKGARLLQIMHNRRVQRGAYGELSFPPALPLDADSAVCLIEISQVESGQLACPAAQTEEEEEDQAVSFFPLRPFFCAADRA